MSRARDFADLAGSADAGGITGKNLVINGAMQVAQRGDSTGITTSGYYACDRYNFTLSSLGTWSVSQSSTAPSGFANSLKLEATTADASPAASDFALLAHKFEGQNLQHLKKGTSSAESITLSFWVRSSKTGTYIVEIRDNDNTRIICSSYTINSADTFEYKTLTFAGDTVGSLDDDNALSFQCIWWLASGTDFTSGTLATSWASSTNANRAVGQVNLADTANATWYITGVQLEVGEQDTPFEHRSYGDELRRCQRYYYKDPAFNGVGFGSTAIARATATHPVPMRATPSVSYSGSVRAFDGAGTLTLTGISVNYCTQQHFNVDCSVSSGGGSSRGVGVVAESYSSSNKIEVDAEL